MSGVFVDLGSYDGIDDVAAQSGDFQPPKPGSYLFKTIDIEVGSSQKGDQMLTIRSEVVGAADGRPSAEVGKHVWARYTWSNNEKERSRAFARGRFKTGLLALGVSNFTEGFNTEDLVGRKFTASVTNRTYQKVGADGQETDNVSADLAAERMAA